MVLFFCLTTLQNWQNCPAALTNHSGFLSIQLGFFRTSRGGANTAPSNPYELIEEITEQCLHRQCSVIFIICLIFGDAVDVSSSRLGKEVAQCDSQRNADTLNRGNA